MKTITLDNVVIPINIIKTNNKHTYFYFRKDGYIEVKKSRFQTDADIMLHIRKNQNKFIKKFKNMQERHMENTSYSIWGNSYQIIENKTFMIDHSNQLLYRNDSIDHDRKKNQLEIDLVMRELTTLIEKFQQHPLVDLTNVRFTVKSMTSRYGSCNKHRRRISINQHLIRLPKEYLEYVFLHEVTHLTYAHHQDAFYQLFEQLCPDYKTLRKSIKTVW
ncbi:M48 family metallopeptidase [Candidatus Xianfuyuplasma coldseepsis]|uniref:M48 family metallopeptidase n=1 Tax=Candidatus Xianfuyuplasma coldseepsis TaxID=2782163 RepID=A0A7L7KS17_9MOLU|nr:M48 family metallopeptidase [Xianfuyuplasma coldseepsis]QMS85620.1 M48 family metallopeptidase [Xianfuyuplasma coldseepsis]